MKLNGKYRLIAIVVVFANSTQALANWPDWRGPTGDSRSDATSHGLFFVNCGGSPNATHLWAVRQGGAGDVTDTHVVWKMTEDVPLESSPVLAGDLLYTLSDRGVLICKQAMTGETVWTKRLDGKYGASLLYADNRIYVSSKQGKTTIIEPGRTFRELAVNELDGELWASPAVAGESLLLRTKTHLYRVQSK